ncbi:hypothetical protein SAMN05444695_102317 [Rhodococcus triatomae]|uniref:Pyridoxamine 5'-phosphate oxidase N-terminal domain-containing protein n=1 Tax=Rhodococcus triatomae TaxID=300028 RepID=A0A1G8DIT2_9NOCA|nr:MSMEG_1061 family FMN-dependent PPOX-type flavoprotein [Rhodococcus triatomae]SDH57552.1 hypothetical protein SAMN05444695_102317 [Rhodococcus triatomae]
MDTGTATADHTINTPEELEQVLGAAHPKILSKHTDFTTPAIRDFISQARFFVLATSDADGNCDCSPRGDITPRALFHGDRTLVIPDRPGNRRADSYRNILSNPHVGVLFVVPGIDEVVRLNGRAHLTVDPGLLAEMAIDGKPATLGVVVEIDEVYAHCARAVLRSRMWEAETWPEPSTVPSIREMAAEQHAVSAGDDPRSRQEEYRKYLY